MQAILRERADRREVGDWEWLSQDVCGIVMSTLGTAKETAWEDIHYVYCSTSLSLSVCSPT